MPSDKFLSYSKFNKKYLDPITTNSNLIEFNIFSYYHSLLEDGISSFRNNYIMPHPRYMYNLQRKYIQSVGNYTKEELNILNKEYSDIALKHSFVPSFAQYGSSTIYIYPYPVSDFVSTFYSNYIPSEKDYIISQLISLNYIIPFEDYTLLRKIKITKDDYSCIKQQWKDSTSLNKIVDLMKEAQDILHSHKRDLAFLLNKVDELSEENAFLKQQNTQLTNTVVRSSQLTWS